MQGAMSKSSNGQSLHDGQSKLELLLFDLCGDQLFGINVFRVSEALPCPKLNRLPASNDYVKGVAYVRGTNIPVIDLSKAIGHRSPAAMTNSSIIVCENHRKTYGLLVQNIRQIVNIPWNDVSPPPKMLAQACCVSSIVRYESKKNVQIIDVEHVFEIVDPPPACRYDELAWVRRRELDGVRVLVVEDSKIARQHIAEFLDYIGVSYIVTENGEEALVKIKEWGSTDVDQLNQLSAIITDVEMPVMDGLTLVREIRKDHRLDNIAIFFHSTLGRLLNDQVVSDVKANKVIEKGDYQSLLAAMKKHIQSNENAKLIA